MKAGKVTTDNIESAEALPCSFMGSGPDRERSPVEWGEIPSIRTSVCMSVPPASCQALRPLWQALRPLWQGLSQL